MSYDFDTIELQIPNKPSKTLNPEIPGISMSDKTSPVTKVTANEKGHVQYKPKFEDSVNPYWDPKERRHPETRDIPDNINERYSVKPEVMSEKELQELRKMGAEFTQGEIEDINMEDYSNRIPSYSDIMNRKNGMTTFNQYGVNVYGITQRQAFNEIHQLQEMLDGWIEERTDLEVQAYQIKEQLKLVDTKWKDEGLNITWAKKSRKFAERQMGMSESELDTTSLFANLILNNKKYIASLDKMNKLTDQSKKYLQERREKRENYHQRTDHEIRMHNEERITEKAAGYSYLDYEEERLARLRYERDHLANDGQGLGMDNTCSIKIEQDYINARQQRLYKDARKALGMPDLEEHYPPCSPQEFIAANKERLWELEKAKIDEQIKWESYLPYALNKVPPTPVQALNPRWTESEEAKYAKDLEYYDYLLKTEQIDKAVYNGLVNPLKQYREEMLDMEKRYQEFDRARSHFQHNLENGGLETHQFREDLKTKPICITEADIEEFNKTENLWNIPMEKRSVYALSHAYRADGMDKDPENYDPSPEMIARNEAHNAVLMGYGNYNPKNLEIAADYLGVDEVKKYRQMAIEDAWTDLEREGLTTSTSDPHEIETNPDYTCENQNAIRRTPLERLVRLNDKAWRFRHDEFLADLADKTESEDIINRIKFR